jgi:hypothetical protein
MSGPQKPEMNSSLLASTIIGRISKKMSKQNLMKRRQCGVERLRAWHDIGVLYWRPEPQPSKDCPLLRIGGTRQWYPSNHRLRLDSAPRFVRCVRSSVPPMILHLCLNRHLWKRRLGPPRILGKTQILSHWSNTECHLGGFDRLLEISPLLFNFIFPLPNFFSFLDVGRFSFSLHFGVFSFMSSLANSFS